MKRNADIILTSLTFLFILAGLAFALLIAPTERVMGDVQRIFYFHFACAMAAFASFTCALISSVAFILRRNAFSDSLANAAVEVGVLFTTLVLVTGPIWARPVWGRWWVWDPRLTTTLVLWFLYVGYLVLGQALPGYRGAMARAVFAVLAYVDVPIVYFSVTLWRGIHPQVLRTGGLSGKMVLPLLAAVTGFLFLSACLIRERFRLAVDTGSIDRITFALEDSEL